jgi:hypothetical protein
LTAALEDEVRARLEKLNPGERRLAEIRLERILRRRKAVQEFRSPGHIAKFSNPEVRQTGMMVALDKAVLSAEAGLQRRWIISTTPQEGKTLRLGTAAPLWFLLRDPSRRIVVASYEQGLAARSCLAVRQLIETYGGGYKGENRHGAEDHFGLVLDPDKAMQTNWQVADVPGRVNGGMTAVGVGSAFTGRSADILVIDDAVKDAKAADSPQQRKVIWDWFRAVATTRLAGNAIIIVIGTRWHEDDLIGRLLRRDDAEPTPLWSRLVIRAQAESDDPLGRTAGEYLASARKEGRDWIQIRRDVGERWWAALYQGRPAPEAGGVFKQDWFDRYRRTEAPELVTTKVFVDPADNEGAGNEAGVMCAGKGVDERYYLLADRSDTMTSQRWLRVAFLMALEYGADEVAYEQSLSGLKRTARTVWKDMAREARKLHELWKALPRQAWPAHIDPKLLGQAVDELARDDADAVEKSVLESNLIELWPWVPVAINLPVSGVPIRAFPAKGSKTFRAKIIAPLFEGGHVSYVGWFPELEHQLITWQESQKSPDRMDTAVHAFTELSRIGGASKVQPAQGRMPTRTSRLEIARQAGGRRW